MSKRLLLWVILLASTFHGQEFRASLSGEVTDSSGAPVPGAQVVVTNVLTTVTHEAVANEAGRYNVNFLQPGTYTLAVEKAGFKKFVRDRMTLEVSQHVSLDVRLEVGQLTESVTVAGEVSLLQTESATRTHTIEMNLIQKTPNNGRNPFLLTHALPGVTKTGYWGSAELYAYGQVSGVSISGGKVKENESLIDGVTDTRPSRDVNFIPALDSLSEVSVQTNLYDAQFSRTGGGVNVFGTKSGTNQLHGAMYEHLKHEKLNALGWANAKGLAELRAANPNGAQPNLKFRNNTYGAEFDGPLFIPKLFDGRNRVFFMISFEGLQERHPSGQTVTLPTADQ
ncbi:MAG TPA: carboxypeptidase-like regulatory domain-containing protein, partial [Bryobacteraceae bacterium]|nr:carboxypeptidase-like regulatory domain-containing protein [Bryobacteraceae bacterium]